MSHHDPNGDYKRLWGVLFNRHHFTLKQGQIAIVGVT